MTVHTPNPNPNAFVRTARKVYNPAGFTKGYNFVLYFIFAGALLGFELAKLPILDINGYWKKTGPPGEYFWYSKKFYNIMLHLHLICIIPAGILVVFQFLPVIRYKVMMFHRINGYAIILLLLVANVGALGISRRAFGGALATQVAMGVLAILTTTSVILSYINIKRLQIDQHRAWMLRTWFYAGSIITLRLIQIAICGVISQTGEYFHYYTVMRCSKIVYTAGMEVASTYPACAANPDTGLAVVRANLSGATNILEAAAALEVAFSSAAWLALVIHAVGIEIYLNLTRAEGERLRRVSYKRQMERGLLPPGSAGLTADKLGDVEAWVPPVEADMTAISNEEDSNKAEDSSSDIARPHTALGWV
ncbi:hypothetical protein LTR97_003500 [Elasticomyces elasticus]|uniref:Uncharacterized protein n=1 Tax=Elasticomyces elasticus TaxID=574655 RepID=A0AAN7WE64_9PEZI|nr:hypothetical protein LTR97_003500 [Elasticomyces elasticus]